MFLVGACPPGVEQLRMLRRTYNRGVVPGERALIYGVYIGNPLNEESFPLAGRQGLQSRGKNEHREAGPRCGLYRLALAHTTLISGFITRFPTKSSTIAEKYAYFHFRIAQTCLPFHLMLLQTIDLSAHNLDVSTKTSRLQR